MKKGIGKNPTSAVPKVSLEAFGDTAKPGVFAPKNMRLNKKQKSSLVDPVWSGAAAKCIDKQRLKEISHLLFFHIFGALLDINVFSN